MRDDFEGLNIIESSLFTDNDAAYALLQDGGELKLAILETDAGDWQGERIPKNTHSLVIAPKTPHNTALLRKRLPWLNPSLLGLRTSAGMGDRLGWATPGHIRAVRDVGGKIAPIFAQQSIREMNRTGRTAQQVGHEPARIAGRVGRAIQPDPSQHRRGGRTQRRRARQSCRAPA